MNNQASNVTSNDQESKKKIYVNFNQDYTSLALGSKDGYNLYVLNNVDSLESIYFSNPPEEVSIVERLFSSSLIAVVTVAAPRKLKVYHFKKGSEICNYSYSNTILSVKLNRNRVVVVLENSLYVHDIRDMKVMHTIRDTPPNPKGIVALSFAQNDSLVAYPGSSNSGQVQIFDASNLRARGVINAHESSLSAVAFSPNGKTIATASDKGTVIRIHSVMNGEKLKEFRRGMSRCVEISCLMFSECGQYIGCSSNTESVHIFKVVEDQNMGNQQAEESTWIGYFTSYLPTQVTDVFKQERAFAIAYMPFKEVKNVVAIKVIQDHLRLMVATEEGIVYIYNINTNDPGDVTFYKKHNIIEEEISKEKQHQQQQQQQQQPSTSEPLPIGGCTLLGSYAGIVKGNPAGIMSDSEKRRAVLEETATPPRNSYNQMNYEQDYPPLTQD